MFAASGKSVKKFKLIFPLNFRFLLFSIPKFNLKTCRPPFFQNISPILWSPPSRMFFRSPSPFLKFSKFAPSLLKEGTHYRCIVYCIRNRLKTDLSTQHINKVDIYSKLFPLFSVTFGIESFFIVDNRARSDGRVVSFISTKEYQKTNLT